MFQLTSNGKSFRVLKEYLDSIEGITAVQYSRYEEFVTVTAPISVLENMFDTVFFTISNKKTAYLNEETNKKLLAVRTLQYKLPKALRGHVTTVFNTVQAPVFKRGKGAMGRGDEAGVSPSLLSKISDNIMSTGDVSGENQIENEKNAGISNESTEKDNVSGNVGGDTTDEGKKSPKKGREGSGVEADAVRMGLTFPKLLNEVYNINSNKGDVFACFIFCFVMFMHLFYVSAFQ